MRLLEQQKRDLRSSFRQRAELFQAPQSAYQVELLNENLIRFLQSQSGIWAAFKGDSHEPRLDKVVQANKHIRWVYPRIEEEQLVFVSSDQFKKGKYGLEEPVGSQVVEVSDINGFLVPGLAFDREGFRLGRGKGFYDKTLAKATGLKVGICFGFQIYEGKLPRAAFDMNMDFIASEQAVWMCRSM